MSNLCFNLSRLTGTNTLGNERSKIKWDRAMDAYREEWRAKRERSKPCTAPTGPEERDGYRSDIAAIANDVNMCNILQEVRECLRELIGLLPSRWPNAT